MENLLSEELTLQDQQQFQAVWSRVMAGKPNPIVVGQQKSEKTPLKPSGEISCFGEKSRAGLLDKAMEAYLNSISDYKKLERQLPSKLKQNVQNLLMEKKRQYNQIETAYFLLTGLAPQHTQDERQGKPVPADKRLRLRFQECQLWQSEFQRAAFQSLDSCLTTLFLQLEQGCKVEAQALHGLVEAVFWMKHQ